MKESDNKGCVHEPLLPIEPDHCPPDMLHMKKGIISKLLNQVVEWVVLQGREESLMNEMKVNKIPFRYVMTSQPVHKNIENSKHGVI